MAAGKSTVGPILANTIGWEFLDIDKEIERKSGKKITRIFSENGEAFFRKLENETLKEISKLSKHIIALGGGTIASEENLRIIKESGILIYLQSSPETAYRRLRYKRDRPALLFEGEDEPTKEAFIKRIEELLESRKMYYEKSDIIIDTDFIPVGRTVDRIALIINKKYFGNEN